MGQVPGGFQTGGGFGAVEIDGGAGVVLDSGPVFESDAGQGAIGEEGGFFGILEDSNCCRYPLGLSRSFKIYFIGGGGCV